MGWRAYFTGSKGTGSTEAVTRPLLPPATGQASLVSLCWGSLRKFGGACADYLLPTGHSLVALISVLPLGIYGLLDAAKLPASQFIHVFSRLGQLGGGAITLAAVNVFSILRENSLVSKDFLVDRFRTLFRDYMPVLWGRPGPVSRTRVIIISLLGLAAAIPAAVIAILPFLADLLYVGIFMSVANLVLTFVLRVVVINILIENHVKSKTTDAYDTCEILAMLNDHTTQQTIAQIDMPGLQESFNLQVFLEILRTHRISLPKAQRSKFQKIFDFISSGLMFLMAFFVYPALIKIFFEFTAKSLIENSIWQAGLWLLPCAPIGGISLAFLAFVASKFRENVTNFIVPLDG